jgi:hypothetical protein
VICASSRSNFARREPDASANLTKPAHQTSTE